MTYNVVPPFDPSLPFADERTEESAHASDLQISVISAEDVSENKSDIGKD
jgi:hypothetical protein